MDQQSAPAPEPEAAAQAHSEQLRERIRQEIASAGGALPFHDYMQLALYEPGLGYYAAAGGAALGDGEDFITAPAVSPLFGRCLARQCAEVLQATGGGTILEPGPGTGILAVSLLTELERLGCLPEQYYLLEVSAELRAQQRAALEAEAPHLLPLCQWQDRWPGPFTGVIVANEVADALPVEIFRKTGEGIERRCVTISDAGALTDLWQPAPAELSEAVHAIEVDIGGSLPSGYISEYRPRLPGWIAGLADCLARGALLLIDYGYVRSEYYMPERDAGTLVCTRAHRAHGDPYDWPGLTDITAFVDFTAVTEAATAAGLDLEGFTPQSHFLFATGLEEAAGTALAADDDRTRLLAASQIKTLTLPGEMGERFNVLGFSRGLERPLRGFASLDLSRRL